MKKSILSILTVLFVTTIFAQAPQGFNYQAVVRDNNGDAIANSNVSLRFILHQTTAGGTVVYRETHSLTTTDLGLANVVIGEGTPLSGTFNTIDWGSDVFFMEVKLDPAGGSSYSSLGTQRLMSVPYAMHATTVENADDADADPLNEINTSLELIEDSLVLTDAGGSLKVDVSGLSRFSSGQGISSSGCKPMPDDFSAKNEGEDIVFSLALVEMWQSFTANSTGDLTEMQWRPSNTSDLLISGTLTVHQGVGLGGPVLFAVPLGAANFGWNTVDILPSVPVKQDSVYTLAISSPAPYKWVFDAFDSYPGGENLWGTRDHIFRTTISNACVNDTSQVLQVSDAGTIALLNVDSLVFSDGTTMTSDVMDDIDPTNEIQSLSTSGHILSISDGNSVNLGPIFFQSLSLSGDILSISSGNNVDLSSFNDADGDPSNEIQTLGLSSNTLSITGGNDVDLSAFNDADGSPTNELQSLNISSNTLSISAGNSVAVDGSPTNELQSLNISSNTLSISAGNSVAVDGSPTNEIQNIAQVLTEGNDANGNSIVDVAQIGLGTNTPSSIYLLDALDDNESDGVGGRIRVESSDEYWAGQVFTNNSREYFIGVQWTEEAYDNTNSGFQIYDNTAGTRRLVIDHTGKVGIGTDAPDQMLTVNGDASKVGTPLWAVFSDQRLKKDISDFSDGLNIIEQINTVKFKYNGKAGHKADGKEYVGIIAQEVQEYAPYMINPTLKKLNEEDAEETELLMYDGSALLYILVNAVQEQQAVIKEQAALIGEQEEELEGVKASSEERLGSLEEKVRWLMGALEIGEVKK